MAQNLSALPVGARVRDINNRYFGQPIIHRVAAKNHAGYPANSVTLITDRILCLKSFDAREPTNPDANRNSSGNNRYLWSNLRRWLNSEAAANAWYAAQHTHDAPPNSANVWSNHNPYDNEAGFLSGLSPEFRAALMPTTLTVARNTVTDGGGSETVTDRIFLASNTEVGLANENGIAEGALLALFSDNASRLAIPTPQCVSNSTWRGSGFDATAAWWWWLRTPNATASHSARNVSASGTLSLNSAWIGHRGVRPLCNISSEILVSDSPDGDGVYTILWNQPPTAPDGITTPANILAGRDATITWGLSTDPDGSVSGYVLERAASGGAFIEIYRGVNRFFTETIQSGWSTVQYRARAFDNHNLHGPNTTSNLQNVITSNPPVISGSDTDLGLQTGAFSQTYTVTNPDAPGLAKTLTVTERISGRVKRTFTATSGAQNTFSVTADEWLEILNGNNALTITATDNFEGSAVRTFAFTKSVTEIEFTLTTPLASDEAVTRLIMTVLRQIPSSADFSVEVCNNAYDSQPTWEDVTIAILSHTAFTLQNDTKTAAEWGFNIRVKVNRQGAAGDCYIRAIGGNFE